MQGKGDTFCKPSSSSSSSFSSRSGGSDENSAEMA
eukprot:CAMPEP_0206566524 /NCGR_PEP_ID=MMETSP0325_2-20121206/24711_1 /ASSEMBLY_ACC=CAM_ASM_000347 /TAXON_ID=2866 /ORGANISM="Crypthecodinium cohnii, Strain Seligo" /LENGTH=34 /DNA_ID= /DNA_START= /DNA_END= /DNA_ORIENTATION=